jgi:hypothetical protein
MDKNGGHGFTDFFSVVTTLSLCPLLFALHAAKAISLVRKVRGGSGKRGYVMRRMDPRLRPAGMTAMRNWRGDKRGQLVGMHGEGARWQKKRVIPESGYRESILEFGMDSLRK